MKSVCPAPPFGVGLRAAGPHYPPGMASDGAEDPRRHPGRTVVLTGLVGNAGGRRMFVDATGTAVPMPPAVRRLVATDERVGALLLGMGAPVVGCAGVLDGIEPVGGSRGPDPDAVAALRPDVIVIGAVDGVPDLADAGLVERLRRVAPVIAVDTGRPAHAQADLRALLGSGGPARPRAEPSSFDAPPGPPPRRPELW